MSSFFASEEFTTAMDILKNQFPLAIWETVYVTVLSTFFAAVIGLPLGILLKAPPRPSLTATAVMPGIRLLA